MQAHEAEYTWLGTVVLSSLRLSPRGGSRAFALAGAAFAIVACSGATPTELFTPSSTTAGVADASRADGSETTDSGGEPGDGGSVPVVDAGRDATTAPIDASTDASLRDASIDAAPVVDSAVDRIDCPGAPTGSTSLACTVGKQTCCRRGAAASYTYACESPPPAGCTSSGMGSAPLSVTCDDARDCAALGRPTTVCCGDYVTDAQNQPSVVSVSCVLAARCLKTQSRVVLCGDGDGAQCPAATHCDVSQTALPGFRICVAN